MQRSNFRVLQLRYVYHVEVLAKGAIHNRINQYVNQYMRY